MSSVSLNPLSSNPNSAIQQEKPQVESDKQQALPDAMQDSNATNSALDTVSLTDRSQQLQEFQQAVAQLPVIDSKKVEDIKEAIIQGQYQINAESIASKLWSFEQSLEG